MKEVFGRQRTLVEIKFFVSALSYLKNAITAALLPFPQTLQIKLGHCVALSAVV